jgi:hypothetical protein
MKTLILRRKNSERLHLQQEKVTELEAFSLIQRYIPTFREIIGVTFLIMRKMNVYPFAMLLHISNKKR